MNSGTSDVDRVREATDLVQLIGEHLALKPRGREHVGLCPFHDDTSPSLAVVTHKGQAFYKCHACGAAGDAFTFVMEYLRKDFPEALRFLADRAGIDLSNRQPAPTSGSPSKHLKSISEWAARRFASRLMDQETGQVGRAVIERRRIAPEMVERFGLGLSANDYHDLDHAVSAKPDARAAALEVGLLKKNAQGQVYDAFRNRMMFPIHDEVGSVIAFGARAIDPDDQPKYLNSAESPIFQKSDTLYGLHLARRAIVAEGRAIVTEGYTDVIACHQAGLEHVVGTLGTALTREHARRLSRLCDTVVLLFDGDEAGQRAADRGVEVFFHEPVDVRICALPDGCDPDDLLHQPDGRSRLEQALDGAQDALQFKLCRFQSRLEQIDSVSGRAKALGAFLAELADLGFDRLQGVRKRWVLTTLAETLRVPHTELERAIPAARPSRATSPAATPRPADDARLAFEEDVSRARRLAERHLLALLLFDPEGARSLPDLADLTPALFREPIGQRIAGALWPHLAAEGEGSMARVLADLPNSTDRDTAAGLYFQGQKLTGDTQVTAEMVNAAVAALHDCDRREALTSQLNTVRLDGMTPPEQLDALQDLLERRRAGGDLPDAIVQGVRG